MSPAGVWNLIPVSNVCKTVLAKHKLPSLNFSRLHHHQHQSNPNQRHNLCWVSQKQLFPFSSDGYGHRCHRCHRSLSTTNGTNDNAAAERRKPLKYTPSETPTKEAKTIDGIRPGMTFSEIKAEAMKKTTGGLGVKGLIKKYGLPFTIYYSTLYFGGMGCCYLALESGVIGEAGVLDWVRMTPIADYVDLSKIDPKHGNIAGAVVINEIMEIVRLPLAILTIPYIKAAWDKRKAPTQEKP